jgi:TonB family protein
VIRALLPLALTLAACGTTRADAPPVVPPRAAAGAPGSSQAGGDGFTVLRSRKWKYAGFIRRMKRQVDEKWEPMQVWSGLPPATTASLGTAPRETRVLVVLSPAGDLLSLQLEASSGVAALDDEAMRAFRAAGRFDNPPSGLVKGGRIELRFRFVADTTEPVVDAHGTAHGD